MLTYIIILLLYLFCIFELPLIINKIICNFNFDFKLLNTIENQPDINQSNQPNSSKRHIENIHDNTINIPDSNSTEITNKSNNSITIRDRQVNITVNNNNLNIVPNQNNVDPGNKNSNNSSLISIPLNSTFNIDNLDNYLDLFTKVEPEELEIINNTQNSSHQIIEINSNNIQISNYSDNKININSNDNLSNYNKNIITLESQDKLNSSRDNLLNENTSNDKYNKLQKQKSFSNLKKGLGKLLKSIKSENNLFNKFTLYKSIKPKVYELTNDNLFKISSLDEYKKLLSINDDIIKFIKNNINVIDTNKYYYVLNIFNENNNLIFKYLHIQFNLIEFKNNLLLNSNSKFYKELDAYLNQEIINYNKSDFEGSSKQFNKLFLDKFYNKILINLQGFNNIYFITNNLFKEFYLFNDLDYLSSKNNNYKINISLLESLFKTKDEIKLLLNQFNNEQLLNLYNLYNNNFNDFISNFDQSTISEYNSNNKPIIEYYYIKNSREVEYLLKLFNKF